MPQLPTGFTWKKSAETLVVGHDQGSAFTPILLPGTRFSATREVREGPRDVLAPLNLYEKGFEDRGWVETSRAGSFMLAPVVADGPDGNEWSHFYLKEKLIRAVILSSQRETTCNDDSLSPEQLKTCQKEHPTYSESVSIFVSDAVPVETLAACLGKPHPSCP